MESYVLDALQQQLMAPEIVEEFVREFHAELNRARSERGAQKAAAARKLEQVERQIDALVSALAEGMKSTSVATRLGLLEAERETLVGQATSEPEPPVRMHPNLAALYRKRVEALREALADEETRTEALGILRSLIEAVCIHPIEGGYEIELVGEIANMVDVAEGAGIKKAALGRTALNAEDRRSAKLVAGARFELTTFRL